jgi:hypothetical protein
MKALNSLFALALLFQSSSQEAMMPPSPDKILTPHSSTAASGCKLLASDKGFPSNATWIKELPGVIPKEPGTLGADYTVVARSVKDVQRAVNFARIHNVRLSVLNSGHDFMGR